MPSLVSNTVYKWLYFEFQPGKQNLTCGCEGQEQTKGKALERSSETSLLICCWKTTPGGRGGRKNSRNFEPEQSRSRMLPPVKWEAPAALQHPPCCTQGCQGLDSPATKAFHLENLQYAVHGSTRKHQTFYFPLEKKS